MYIWPLIFIFYVCIYVITLEIKINQPTNYNRLTINPSSTRVGTKVRQHSITLNVTTFSLSDSNPKKTPSPNRHDEWNEPLLEIKRCWNYLTIRPTWVSIVFLQWEKIDIDSLLTTENNKKTETVSQYTNDGTVYIPFPNTLFYVNHWIFKMTENLKRYCHRRWIK